MRYFHTGVVGPDSRGSAALAGRPARGAKDKKSAAISLPTEMSRMLWIRKLFSKKPKIAIEHSLNSRCGGSFGIHSPLN
ncbi:protein of unknown function [Acidithiobacillus ferrivorans]|uniref:Uncharacterized protein n=1 Tax=Acidithiobacillus ferrivorans TaxID=160808 RepID=A0ABY1ML32_9PROT|nr:protein of unknown function [Acidithiobacillus ferrivorans]